MHSPRYARGRLSLSSREPLVASRLSLHLEVAPMPTPTPLPRRLSPGGWVIIDDWNLAPCRRAVLHFRRHRGIEAAGSEMLQFYSGKTSRRSEIPSTEVNVFWQKPRGVDLPG